MVCGMKVYSGRFKILAPFGKLILDLHVQRPADAVEREGDHADKERDCRVNARGHADATLHLSEV